jgi:hypothetical protein
MLMLQANSPQKTNNTLFQLIAVRHDFKTHEWQYATSTLNHLTLSETDSILNANTNDSDKGFHPLVHTH